MVKKIKTVIKYINLLLNDIHVLFYLKDYIQSIINKKNHRSNYPWMTYRFITWAKKNINKNNVILEFGSGNSTRFFSNLVKEITSIEHNWGWYKTISESIKEYKNTNYYYLSEEEYLNYHEDDIKYKYNVLIIDGIKRVEVFKKYGSLIKKGYIILDNAERKEYKEIHDALSGYESLIFEGLSPYNAKITMTKVWLIR